MVTSVNPASGSPQSSGILPANPGFYRSPDAAPLATGRDMTALAKKFAGQLVSGGGSTGNVANVPTTAASFGKPRRLPAVRSKPWRYLLPGPQAAPGRVSRVLVTLSSDPKLPTSRVQRIEVTFERG